MLTKTFNKKHIFAFKRQNTIINDKHILIYDYQFDENLCNKLVEHNYNLINNIPPKHHTEYMYDLVMKKSPTTLARLNLNEKLREPILNSLVNDKDILPVYFTGENIKHLTRNNLITLVNRRAYNFNYVPKEKQELVLSKLKSSFFTQKTLSEFVNIKMSSRVFNCFFGHIQLFRVTDKNFKPLLKYYVDNSDLDDGCGIPNGTGWYNLPENNVTWEPRKFVEITGWKYARNINSVIIPRDKDSEIIFTDSHAMGADFEVINKKNDFMLE